MPHHARSRQETSEVKLLCRLIALHQKKPSPGARVNLFVDGVTYAFLIRNSVNIGHNVCCLVFEKLRDTLTEHQHLIFAFNWFSPVTVWDYVSLGVQFLLRPEQLDHKFGLCSAMSMDQAQRFLDSPEMQKLCQELRNDAERTRITLTGFSMGGSTSHAFALLLREELKLRQDIRCVAFGSPRPGNAKLADWFTQNLTPDSMNVLLATKCPQTLCRDDNDATSSDVTQGTCMTFPPMQRPVWSTGGLGNNRITNNSKLDPQQYNELVEDAGHGDRTMKTLYYDPVTCSPSTRAGFGLHPNCYVLIYEEPGCLFPMTPSERHRLHTLDCQEQLSSAWSLVRRVTQNSTTLATSPKGSSKLHSVLKYYETLCAASGCPS